MNYFAFNPETPPFIFILCKCFLCVCFQYRLGLERSQSAREALDVMTQLLCKHGQGGFYSEDGCKTYHNSFLMCDHKEAWILETAETYWAAEQITSMHSFHLWPMSSGLPICAVLGWLDMDLLRCGSFVIQLHLLRWSQVMGYLSHSPKQICA